MRSTGQVWETTIVTLAAPPSRRRSGVTSFRSSKEQAVVSGSSGGVSWALGTPTQKKTGVTIRPITRDGGARLSVPGRLYDSVSGSHQPEIAESWGKFWR